MLAFCVLTRQVTVHLVLALITLLVLGCQTSQNKELVVSVYEGRAYQESADLFGGTVLGIYGVSDPQRYQPWGGATIGSADALPEPNRVVERLLQAIDPLPLQPGNS